MKEKLVLIGGGGHAHSCIDVIEKVNQFEIVGILDLPEKLGTKVLNYEVKFTDDDLQSLTKIYKNFFISLGQIKSPEKRISYYKKLKSLGAYIPSIVSPKAYVSEYAKIGEGSIIMHGAIINSNAVIKSNCIVNTKALVEHDALIGNHCHIATAAIVNGHSKVLSGSFVGSGSVLKHGITIGENSIIQAGSTILKNL